MLGVPLSWCNKSPSVVKCEEAVPEFGHPIRLLDIRENLLNPPTPKINGLLFFLPMSFFFMLSYVTSYFHNIIFGNWFWTFSSAFVGNV